MLKMDVEADPLTLKDPLDCSEGIEDNDDSPGWMIQLNPEVVSGVLTKDSEVQRKTRTSLRARKRKQLFVENEPVIEKKLKNKTKQSGRKNTRKIGRQNEKKEKLESDEENVVPLGNEKVEVVNAKLKRKNHGKKYKLTKENKSYVCDVCKKTFLTASHLKEHALTDCHGFSCEECGKVFIYNRSLQRHLSCAHDSSLKTEKNEETDKKKEDAPSPLKTGAPGEKSERCKKYYEQLKSERKYQCEICQKTFITNGHLNTHMYCHSEKKWKCDGCGKHFSCERSLIRHQDTFPGKHWFPCQLCDMTFFRVVNIVKHMEIKHPEFSIDVNRARELNLPLEIVKPEPLPENLESLSEKLLVCSKCLKVFYDSETLSIHNQAMHSSSNHSEEAEENVNCLSSLDDPVPNYKCDICSKEFVSLEGFEYHKNNQHVDKTVKKRKRKKGDFDEEDRMEVGETSVPTFVCKICSASFSVKSALQTHLKSHNVSKNMEVKTGSHQCCICPRSFASSDGLKYHLATHTGERRYSCNKCGRKFIKKTHLSEHVATHSEVKYFKCLRCPRTFSTHSAYRKHVKHFPGPHSFPCVKCGKLFTKESMLEKHMCVDLMKITMAPEVKALLSEDMIEEYLCLAEEQAAEEFEKKSELQHEESSEMSSNENSKIDGSSDSHSCYKCFKVFPSLSALQSHQFEHIGKQSYQCRFCPESFKRADTFGAHIRNHLGSTPYMCLKCNRKFISPLTLSMHAKNYPGDHSFTCQKCQRWFPSEKRVEKHDCILQNSDIFICACGSVFKSWNELLQHAGTKPYKCCSCDLKYPTLIALARHIKKHTGIKPFTCEVCGKSFRAKSNYLYHKNVHRVEKELKCEHCDFKSKSQKRMDYHLFRKHDIGSNTTSALCPICGVIFPFKSHMKKHLEQVHGNDLMKEPSKDEKKNQPTVLCTLCGKLLNSKYTLANHMKKVHNPNDSKENWEFKCEVCGEKFKSSQRLEKHAETHETPGLRNCEVCNQAFYFAKDLKKHMKRHDTNKPYLCFRCGKNFKVSVSLRYHSSICAKAIDRAIEGQRQLEKIFGHAEPLDLVN